MKKSTKYFIGILIIVILGIWFFGLRDNSSGKYDGFAQCLTDKGAKMWGAWWCGHCADQKALFGKKSFGKINYIECSTSNRQQTPYCDDNGVKGYPTWDFANGSRESRVLTLEELSQKTGCELPVSQ